MQLKVNSTKSMTGHLLGASGPVEAVATVKVVTFCFLHCILGKSTETWDLKARSSEILNSIQSFDVPRLMDIN